MDKLRYVIVGSGWRAMFYVRIAKALPERFEVCAMVCRTQEKAEEIRAKYKIPVSLSEEECRDMKPDFAVIAVDKPSIGETACRFADWGVPVLCETPAGLCMEDLERLWELADSKKRSIQVAEQYLFYPSVASRLAAVESGILGEPEFMDLSLAHGYHGASMIRAFLNTWDEKVSISGRAFPAKVAQTGTREGAVYEGEIRDYMRERLTLEFESGKTAFYDFCGVQYHSAIRTRRLNVQGPLGELDGFRARYLDGNMVPACEAIEVKRGFRGTVESVALGARILYRNPFPGSGLTEDETAVASVLDGMEAYLRDGIELYPLRHALQDAYLSILMENALKQPGKPVCSSPQPWQGRG